jgi:dTDP-4-dehydrorhamnose reductase
LGLVLRFSLLFAGKSDGGYFTSLVQSLKSGQKVPVFTDEWRLPLSTAEAARALVELATQSGLLHVAGEKCVTRYEFAREVVELMGSNPNLLHSCTRQSMGLAKERPGRIQLATSKAKMAGFCPIPLRESLVKALEK